ncbi:hypothetical protein D3C77_368360 [compost metagenome]
MDFQMLATEQHRHISRLLASDCKLVHDLQLHIFGHALFPEACPVYAGSFAFEDLHLWSADYLAVDIGKHPGQRRIGMLKHRVDPSNLVLTALAVMPGHDRLQDIAPVQRAFLIVRIDLGHAGIATGLLQPQLQL